MNYTIDVPVNFNTRKQLDFLKKVSGSNDDAEILCYAVSIAAESLTINNEHGLPTRILNKCSDGFSEFHIPSDAFTVAGIVAAMAAMPEDKQGSVARLAVAPSLKQRLEYLKQSTGLKEDTQAVAFALQLTYALTDYMQQCKGKAFICFTNDLNRPGFKLSTMFDKTLKARFGRATRKVRNKLRGILPKRQAAPKQ